MAKSGRKLVEPICPMCGAVVQSGEHVVFDGGDLIHIACSTGTAVLNDLDDRLLTALRGSPRDGFCHSCLAGRLGAGHDEVRKAVGRLRLRRGAVVTSGRCGGCRQLRVTIGVRG
jgi:hypothetical protein